MTAARSSARDPPLAPTLLCLFATGWLSSLVVSAASAGRGYLANVTPLAFLVGEGLVEALVGAVVIRILLKNANNHADGGMAKSKAITSSRSERMSCHPRRPCAEIVTNANPVPTTYSPCSHKMPSQRGSISRNMIAARQSNNDIAARRLKIHRIARRTCYHFNAISRSALANPKFR